jgi:hypothetical protein
MALTLRRSNPLEHAASLKTLMVENEHKAFGDFFDRGYADVVERGGASWLGFDAHGTLQMNVTLFRHDFHFRGRTLAAGMLGNMMASKEHRTFFPMVALVKQLLRDVRQEGKFDLIYTDPNPGAAAIMKGARLAHVGNLDRCVIPMGEQQLLKHIAASCYAASQRLRVRGRVADIQAHPAGFDASAFDIPEGESLRLRPHHSAALYRRRLAGYPGPEYTWFEFRLPRRSEGSDAAMLVHGPDANGLAIIYALRRKPDVPVAPLIPPLIRKLRKRGARRLQVEVPRDSDFSRELQGIGFKQRNDLVPVFVHALTEHGAAAAQAFDQWEVTGLDMER